MPTLDFYLFLMCSKSLTRSALRLAVSISSVCHFPNFKMFPYSVRRAFAKCVIDFHYSHFGIAVIIVGRALNLPIETGGVAFIPYELSLLDMFGNNFLDCCRSLIGYIIDRILPVK